MKITSFCLWLLIAVLCCWPGRGAPAQTAQHGKSTGHHSDISPSDHGPRSPVLKELLSSKLKCFQIIYMEEAALWQSRLRQQPNDPQLLLKTANALKAASDYGIADEKAWLEAAQLLLKCVKLDPNNCTAWYSLGNWYTNEMKLDAARQCFDKAKAIGGMTRGLEVAYQSLTEWEAELKSGKRDSSPARANIKPYEKPMYEVHHFDEGNMSENTKALLLRVENNRGDGRGWHELGKSLAKEESQPKDGMKLASYCCLLKAKNLDRRNIEAREMLAELYKDHGARELMKEECRQLLELDPGNGTARTLLAY